MQLQPRLADRLAAGPAAVFTQRGERSWYSRGVRFFTRVHLAALVALGSACQSETVDYFQKVTPVASFPGTPGDPAAYEPLLAYTPDPNCVPAVLRKLDRRTEIRIFVGNGVADAEVQHYAGGLRRYFDFYGVSMFTRYAPIPVPIDHAIVLNEKAIADAMRDAGTDPSCLTVSPTLACERAYGAGMFFNVKQFLHAYAEPDRGVFNLVLLKRVASLGPGSDPETELLNWGIAGLGLSEELLNSAAGSDLGTSLADVLDETNFAPTVFLAVNLTDFLLPAPDIVVAHEFGHAYGLEHLEPADYGANLMNPTANECDLALNASQLTTIEQRTAAFGNLLGVGKYHGAELLSFTDRAQEILDLMRGRVAAAASAGVER